MQSQKDVCLAAADDTTRQRCVRALQAASAGSFSSSIKDIASAVAVTRDLIGMQSLPAVNAVLASLGKAAAKGLDAKSLKEAGLDAMELYGAGFDSTVFQTAGFSIREITFAGIESEFCIVRRSLLRIAQTHTHTHTRTHTHTHTYTLTHTNTPQLFQPRVSLEAPGHRTHPVIANAVVVETAGTRERE